MTDFATGGVIQPAGDPDDDRVPPYLSTCNYAGPARAAVEPYRPPLVTCRFNPQPHELADDCQDVTFLGGRNRHCDRSDLHEGHEWYGPALRYDCPGRTVAAAAPSKAGGGGSGVGGVVDAVCDAVGDLVEGLIR